MPLPVKPLPKGGSAPNQTGALLGMVGLHGADISHVALDHTSTNLPFNPHCSQLRNLTVKSPEVWISSWILIPFVGLMRLLLWFIQAWGDLNMALKKSKEIGKKD